jgi:FemAB-related protein (PEP-CTERM system-associated)
MNSAISTLPKSAVQVHLATSGADAERWGEFVSTHPGCSGYHRWNWKRVFENTFGWNTFYLVAEDASRIRGILPLVRQEDYLFRKSLCSLPHVREAGIVADDSEIEKLLLEGAKQLAHQTDVDHIELRQRADHDFNMPARTDKVVFVLPVQQDQERMWNSLDGKTRNIVRKSMTYGLTAEFNGSDSLDGFYRVFCHNMRDLGAPVYSKVFFHEIILAFPENTHICTVRQGGNVVAAAFLIGFRDSIEVLWSCSLHKYLPFKPNMFLYWNLLCFAAEREFRLFDFGRCSVGTGTYRFKAQWTSQQIPLRWFSWSRNGIKAPENSRGSAKFRAAVWMWQRLPVPFTTSVGPTLIKYITGV